MSAPTLPSLKQLLPLLLRLDPFTRATLTRTLDLADEAAWRGDRAVYARVLEQQHNGETLADIARQLQAERDREER